MPFSVPSSIHGFVQKPRSRPLPPLSKTATRLRRSSDYKPRQLCCAVEQQQVKQAVHAQHVTSQAEQAEEEQQQQQAEAQALEAIQQLEEEAAVEASGEQVALWVGAAAAFGAGIWFTMGGEKAAEYFAGYLLEQSLSVDNLFVFILVFNYFKTPAQDQSTVLNWGIASAAVLRAIMILLGVELIDNFRPVLLGFAAILLWSSYKLLFTQDDDDEEDLSNNAIVKSVRRVIQVSERYDGNKFFTFEDGVRKATPLLLALAVIEISDVIFAVDSVPAVFGVTLDPFIVYTSNIFAILSLRSLFGFVAVALEQLRFLDKAVAVVLGFIGAKMVADFAGYHISTEASLIVVALALSTGVGASLLLPARTEA